jgi:hypothetical protein
MLFLLMICTGIKQTEAAKTQLLRLKAYNTLTPAKVDQTVIYFDTNATAGYDPKFDAYKLMNTDAELVNLYSYGNGSKLSINGLPMIDSAEVTVPLGLKVNTTGEYHIDVTTIQNFAPNVVISLYDAEKNITQNLLEKSAYTFTYKYGLPDGRFFIKFTPQFEATGINNITQKLNNANFKVTAENNYLNISFERTTNNEQQTANISVFNPEGQLVASKDISANSACRLHLDDGIYIIRIQSGSRAFTRKIAVQ